MAVINIGGEGTIILDGVEHEMVQYDGMYIGKGTKEIAFTSKDNENPAKFYMNSASAHKEYPTVKVAFKDANPTKMGSDKEMNKRTIYKYVDPSVCESCQLLMGMTVLEEGSGWNTMPVHLHPRRMEVYFYFNMDENTRVFHLVGKPDETRHIVCLMNKRLYLQTGQFIQEQVLAITLSFGECVEKIKTMVTYNQLIVSC